MKMCGNGNPMVGGPGGHGAEMEKIRIGSEKALQLVGARSALPVASVFIGEVSLALSDRIRLAVLFRAQIFEAKNFPPLFVGASETAEGSAMKSTFSS